MSAKNTKRILIVDDNPDIHADFKKILTEKEKINVSHIQEILFGETGFKTGIQSLPTFQINSAFQGEEALELVKKSIESDSPYSLAFVDIRMPPGWDGIKTIKHIWEVDPDIQVVICTAYSDYSWFEIFTQLNSSENFLILKKPFEAVEVRQLATALAKKWEYKKRLQNKILNLEATVAERTADLQHALDLAEEANQLKNAFLGNVSYELKVPLNAIIGFAELLYFGKVGSAQSNEYLKDILSSAKYLLQMINDIVDMSMLEARRKELQLEKINVRKFLDEIQNIFMPQLKEKYLQFDIKTDPNLPQVVTDPTKLQQIFRYFITNAIKFTPKGGRIEIQLLNHDENYFKIEVKDNGPGISSDNLAKLFVPFRQLDLSMAKKYHGIGLGLALAKRIAELEGGKVGVESEPGKGSCFYACLPHCQ